MDIKNKITINLVSYNGESFLRGCFDSILRQTLSDFNVLIIDNASTDGSWSLIQSTAKNNNWAIIRNKNNIGFAAAHNQGIEKTNSPYILILNQDVILGADFLKEALIFLDHHPEAGAITGKLLRLTKQGKSDIIDSLGLEIFRTKRVAERGAGQRDYGQFNQIKEVFGVSGAAPIYQREALESVKLRQFNEYFDQDFFSFKEDIDLASRLNKNGWKSYYVPQIVAYHHRSAKTSKDFSLIFTLKHRHLRNQSINYYSYRNHLFFLIKNLTKKEFFKNFIFIASFELIKFFYLIIIEPITFSKSLKDFFKLLPKMLKKRKIINNNQKI